MQAHRVCCFPTLYKFRQVQSTGAPEKPCSQVRDWISALKAGDIRKLLKAGVDGSPAPLRPKELVADAVPRSPA